MSEKTKQDVGCEPAAGSGASGSPVDGAGRRRGGRGWLLFCLYLLLAVSPVLLIIGYGAPIPGAFLEEAGKAAGLIGFSLLILQVVLSARFRWIDRPYGLDVVTKFHQSMAPWILVLLLLHPTLLAIGARSWFLFSQETTWDVNLGKLALLLLVGGVVFASFFSSFGVEYQKWRFLHKGMIFVPIFGFVHSIYVSPDLASTKPAAFWIILMTVGVLIFCWRNFYVPWFGGRPYRVASMKRETHDAHTLELRPEKGSIPRHHPGQFMFLRLRRPGRSSEEHPFTISSSPTEEGFLTATIKECGDFTNTIGETREGDEARIEGPYGRFSFVYEDPSAPLVFIAGGVGITPFMSMLRCLRDRSDLRPVVLLWGNKTEADIIFREEIDRMPDGVEVVHVLDRPGEDWAGPRGRITLEMIRERSGKHLQNGIFFVCGPPAMMDKVFGYLAALGVPKSRIRTERFSL